MSWREYPARIAVGLTTLAGVATAIAVPAADLDATSAAGVIGGLLAITTAVAKWQEGRGRYDAAVAQTEHATALAVAKGDVPGAAGAAGAAETTFSPAIGSTPRLSAQDIDEIVGTVVDEVAARMRGTSGA